MIFDTIKKALGGGKKTMLVSSPMKGEVLPLAKSSDPVHQEEMLGKGALIVPSEGKVFAPFKGKAVMVFETGHALGLVSEDGVELLIHVGLDTVKLNGKYFTAHVKDNQEINEGDLLLEFDMEGIKSEGYLIESPIIVTNTGDYKSINTAAEGGVEKNDRLLEII